MRKRYATKAQTEELRKILTDIVDHGKMMLNELDKGKKYSVPMAKYDYEFFATTGIPLLLDEINEGGVPS